MGYYGLLGIRRSIDTFKRVGKENGWFLMVLLVFMLLDFDMRLHSNDCSKAAALINCFQIMIISN